MSRRRCRAGAAVAVGVAAGLGAVVWARADGPGVRVVEVGHAVVEPAGWVNGEDVRDSGRRAEPAWVVVIENERDDRVAHDVHLRVEVLGEDGEAVSTSTPEVEVLGPGSRTAVTGRAFLMPDEEATEVRVEVEDVGRWEHVDAATSALVRDVGVEYGAAGEPIVGFELLEEAGAGSSHRRIDLVFRDEAGEVVGGAAGEYEAGALPTDPRDPRRLLVDTGVVAPDGLATVDVYVTPTNPPEA